jgi:hypothetical protein
MSSVTCPGPLAGRVNADMSSPAMRWGSAWRAQSSAKQSATTVDVADNRTFVVSDAARRDKSGSPGGRGTTGIVVLDGIPVK